MDFRGRYGSECFCCWSTAKSVGEIAGGWIEKSGWVKKDKPNPLVEP